MKFFELIRLDMITWNWNLNNKNRKKKKDIYYAINFIKKKLCFSLSEDILIVKNNNFFSKKKLIL